MEFMSFRKFITLPDNVTEGGHFRKFRMNTLVSSFRQYVAKVIFENSSAYQSHDTAKMRIELWVVLSPVFTN